MLISLYVCKVMYLSVSYIVLFVITTLFINQIRGILLFISLSYNLQMYIYFWK